MVMKMPGVANVAGTGRPARIGWIVDAQNDFMRPPDAGGRLYVHDLFDGGKDAGATQIIPALVRAVEWMAIHRAAGPRLVEECRTLHGCPTGEARITHGFDLPARWVIHTVGPVWQGGQAGEDALLASCYRESLKLARDRELRTVAIPAVSTGVYRFPVHRAARIATAETAAFLRANPLPERVMLVCFGDEARREYLTAVQEAV
jgi:O-acetyl-ADP-ribose deacetylase (regulator of RNase III)